MGIDLPQVRFRCFQFIPSPEARVNDSELQLLVISLEDLDSVPLEDDAVLRDVIDHGGLIKYNMDIV